MAALPQSAAGVPVPGGDPTTEELAQITTLDHTLEWLGAFHLSVELKRMLGGASPRLRDVVYVPQNV